MSEIDNYFKAAGKLPLAISFNDVQSLIRLNGATKPAVKNGWWSLSNYIIIMTTIMLITSISLFVGQDLNTTAIYKTKKERNFIDKSPYQSNTVFFSDAAKIILKKESMHQLNKPNDEFNSKLTSCLVSVSSRENSPTTEEFSDSIVIEREPTYLSNLTVDLSDDILHEESNFKEETVDLEKVKEDELEKNISDRVIDEGKSKTIKKQINSEGIDKFRLNNRNGLIEIKTWDKDEIEVKAIFTIDADEKEDIKKALDEFNFKIRLENKEATVETTWDEISDSHCNQSKRKNKVKTVKGEKFKYNKFKISYQIKVPKKIDLDLKNVYADINLSSVKGNVKLSLFKGDLNAGKIDGTLHLTEKYGNAKVDNFNQGDIILFKSELDMQEAKELQIKSNYSQITTKKIDKLNLIAFKSDIIIQGDIESIEANYKYGDLRLMNIKQDLKLSMFKSKLEAIEINSAEFDVSYSNFKIEKVNFLMLTKAFKNKFVIKELGDLEGSLKYSSLEVETLNSFMELNSFKGKIEVKEIIADFKQLKLITKYTNVELRFNPEAKYEFEAKTDDTDLTLPTGMNNTSLQQGINSHSNIFRGTFNKSSVRIPSKVSVNSFQGNLKLQ